MSVWRRRSPFASPAPCIDRSAMWLPSLLRRMACQWIGRIVGMGWGSCSIVRLMCRIIPEIRLWASWKQVTFSLLSPWSTQVFTRISPGQITGLLSLLMVKDLLNLSILCWLLKLGLKCWLLDWRPHRLWSSSRKSNDFFIHYVHTSLSIFLYLLEIWIVLNNTC